MEYGYPDEREARWREIGRVSNSLVSVPRFSEIGRFSQSPSHSSSTRTDHVWRSSVSTTSSLRSSPTTLSFPRRGRHDGLRYLYVGLVCATEAATECLSGRSEFRSFRLPLEKYLVQDSRTI